MSQEEAKPFEMKQAVAEQVEVAQPSESESVAVPQSEIEPSKEEESKAEEPKLEEPKLEDSKVEESKVKESKVEGSEKAVEESTKEGSEEKKPEEVVTAPPPVLQEKAEEPPIKFTDAAISPPALRRLNGDSSWLLSFPLIDEDSKYSSFNLLIDPWFSPSQQVDFHPLFSAQTRIESAEFGNIGQLEEFLAKEAERGSNQNEEKVSKAPSPQVDGILISHSFTDHMHEETLLDASVRLEIPFYGPKDSVPILRKLFDSKIARAAMKEEDAPTASSRHIHIIPTAHENNLSWELEPNQPSPLPSGFKIFHAPAKEPWHFSVSKGPAWHKLHGGIILLWETSKEETGELIGNGGEKEFKRKFDSLLYSPHGILSNSLPNWLAQSEFKTLCHCLNEQSLPKLLGGSISLGLPNIKDLSNSKNFPSPKFRPDILISTHDERKNSKGLVSNQLKRVVHDKEEAEEKLKLPKLKEGEIQKFKEIIILDPEIGEAISLTNQS